MAINAQSYTVTTTRQAISFTDDDRASGTTVWLYGEFHGSSNKIAIGGPTVTLATGVHLYGAEKFGPIHLAHGETLYVISDSETGLDLRVLTQGA